MTEQTDDEAIEGLARLDMLEYERQRRQAAKALRCRVGVLDQLVESARARARLTALWARRQLAPPWDQPVAGHNGGER